MKEMKKRVLGGATARPFSAADFAIVSDDDECPGDCSSMILGGTRYRKPFSEP
jgi:hypothetical protein